MRVAYNTGAHSATVKKADYTVADNCHSLFVFLYSVFNCSSTLKPVLLHSCDIVGNMNCSALGSQQRQIKSALHSYTLTGDLWSLGCTFPWSSSPLCSPHAVPPSVLINPWRWRQSVPSKHPKGYTARQPGPEVNNSDPTYLCSYWLLKKTQAISWKLSRNEKTRL